MANFVDKQQSWKQKWPQAGNIFQQVLPLYVDKDK